MRSARVSAVLLLLLAVLALLSTSADARRPHSRRSGAAVPTTDSQPLRTVDSSNIDRAFSELQPADTDALALPDADAPPRRAAPPLGPGAFGLDISVAVSQSQFECLRAAGYSFVIIRAWRSLCQFDPNVLASIDAAWAGGMSQDCNLKPEQQVQQTIAGLQGHNFSTLWFDIELEGSSWSTTNPAANLAWIRPAISEAISTLGVSRVGIYTNRPNWLNITGNINDYGYLPLWWARYNNIPSFEGYVPFAQWQIPTVKQFMDGPSVCGVSMDHNWVPL